MDRLCTFCIRHSSPTTMCNSSASSPPPDSPFDYAAEKSLSHARERETSKKVELYVHTRRTVILRSSRGIFMRVRPDRREKLARGAVCHTTWRFARYTMSQRRLSLCGLNVRWMSCFSETTNCHSASAKQNARAFTLAFPAQHTCFKLQRSISRAADTSPVQSGFTRWTRRSLRLVAISPLLCPHDFDRRVFYTSHTEPLSDHVDILHCVCIYVIIVVNYLSSFNDYPTLVIAITRRSDNDNTAFQFEESRVSTSVKFVSIGGR